MTAEINGLNINYTVKGQGNYIFLLHGWGANSQLFSSLADILPEKYTVVLMDFPGFGKSDEPKEVWDVGDYADFTINFIELFKCKNVILLGHSFGGRVILKMTEREPLPFSVDKILFVDSAGVMPVRSKKQNFRIKIYKLGKKLLSIYPIKKMFPNALEALKKKFSSADYANASEIMRGVLVKTVNEDLVHLMKNIKCQTLLIWGENDTVTPVGDAKIFEREISSAGTDVGLALIKNAGHYSFLDQPYVFSNIIKSFLKI